MVDDLKQCLNPRCSRYRIIVASEGNIKRCDVCKSKLRRTDARDDQPPLIVSNGELPEIGDEQIKQYLRRREDREDALGSPIISLNGRDYIRLENGHLAPLERDGFKLLSSGSKPTSEEDFTFTCNPDVEGCPIASKPVVNIPFNLFQDWVWLALRIKTEWLAYLFGTENEATGAWSITSHYFPRQRAHSTHVERHPDEELRPGIIGSVHSHVGMAAFFSGEDKNHFNWPVEMVVNNKGDIKAMVRRKLDCGRYSRIEGSIIFTRDELPDEAALRSALTVVEAPRVTNKTIRTAPPTWRGHN